MMCYVCIFPILWAQALVPILVLERAPVKRPGARTMIGEEEDPEEAERRVQEEKKREETMCKLLKPCVETLQSGLSQRSGYVDCEIAFILSAYPTV